MTLEEVLEQVRQLGCQLVEMTGGEPLLQKEIYPLTEMLLAEGYRVLVETSGERFIGDLAPAIVKIMDVKCPGSGEGGKFCFDNLEALDRKDQAKFVILHEADYRYARDFIAEHNLTQRVAEIIFSPVFGKLPPQRLAEWILRDSLEVRLGLQIHKFIWDPEMHGV